MSQYMLSVHAVEGQTRDPMTPQEMQASMECVMALEAEMKEAGAFVFGGQLTDKNEAKVITKGETGFAMTDGPFAEAKEHIAGIYIINAADLDEAHEWTRKVVDAIGITLEVRPFAEMPDM